MAKTEPNTVLVDAESWLANCCLHLVYNWHEHSLHDNIYIFIYFYIHIICVYLHIYIFIVHEISVWKLERETCSFYVWMFFQSLSWHPKKSFHGKQDSFWRLSCLYLPYNPLWVVVWEIPPRQNDEPCFLHYCQISLVFAGAAFESLMQVTIAWKRQKETNDLTYSTLPTNRHQPLLLINLVSPILPELVRLWGPAILTQPKETFRSCRCRLGRERAVDSWEIHRFHWTWGMVLKHSKCQHCAGIFFKSPVLWKDNLHLLFFFVLRG